MKTLVCAWKEDGNLPYWCLEDFNSFWCYVVSHIFEAEAERRHYSPVTESRAVGYTFSVDAKSEPIFLSPETSIVVVTMDGIRDALEVDYSLGRPVGAGELWLWASYLAQPHRMNMTQNYIEMQRKAAADFELHQKVLAGLNQPQN